jgi:hypothetical protein
MASSLCALLGSPGVVEDDLDVDIVGGRLDGVQIFLTRREHHPHRPELHPQGATKQKQKGFRGVGLLRCDACTSRQSSTVTDNRALRLGDLTPVSLRWTNTTPILSDIHTRQPQGNDHHNPTSWFGKAALEPILLCLLYAAPSHFACTITDLLVGECGLELLARVGEELILHGRDDDIQPLQRQTVHDRPTDAAAPALPVGTRHRPGQEEDLCPYEQES